MDKAETIRNLPHDIIVDILSRLPVKSLLRFRCVCKHWCTLIHHPQFIDMHLCRSKPGIIIQSFKYTTSSDLFFMKKEEEFKDQVSKMLVPTYIGDCRPTVLGSCNGLVCLKGYSYYDGTITIHIYNPATDEVILLPEVFPFSDIGFGFGFDSATKDYKVVQFVKSDKQTSLIQYEIFTLGTQSWRRISDVPLYPIEGKTGKPLLANRALHWIFSNDENQNFVILAIDVSEENFQIISFPLCLEGLSHDPYLIELKGHLSLCMMSESEMDIWILKDSSKSIWIKEYSFSFLNLSIRLPFYQCLLATQDNNILLFKKKELFSINPEHSTISKVETSIIGDFDWLNACSHVETLVSCKYAKD